MNNYKTLYEKVIKAHGDALVYECKGFYSTALYPSDKLFHSVNNDMSTQISDICNRHSLFKMLIITREIPCEYILHFLDKFNKNLDEATKVLIVNEAMLLATNYILAFSNNENNIESIDERKSLDVSEDDIIDAFRLIFFSSVNRYNNFSLNDFTRTKNTVEAVREEVTKSYNTRELRRRPSFVETNDSNAIVSLVSAKTIDAYTINVKNADGTLYVFQFTNWFPVTIAGKTIFERFQYLESKEFSNIVGLPFKQFFQCFIALNRLLINNLPNWSDDSDIVLKSDRHEADMQRLQNLSTFGIDGGSISSIKNSYKLLKQLFSETMPDERFFHKFIDIVTCKQLEQDTKQLDFIEIPYLLYQVGPDRTIWDASRHWGFIKAWARKVLTYGGNLGNYKGKFFEEHLIKKIKKLDVQDVQHNVKIIDDETKNITMEIDIGFVYNNCLFVVEAKSFRKSIGEYKGINVKVHKPIKFLLEKDKKVELHKKQILKQWKKKNIDCIVVMITDEVEFIPTFDPALWLRVGEISRICTIEEFIEYLISI